MALGPGIYDDLCTYVRKTANAKVAIVIVIDGSDGSGMSCQVGAEALGLPISLPDILEQVARDIRAGIAEQMH